MGRSIEFKEDGGIWTSVQWSEKAENDLGELLEDGRDVILSDLKNGMCDLWRADYVTGESGWLMLRLDIDSIGNKEMVLICGRGDGMSRAIKTLKKRCVEAGVKSIRAHSHRKGYERLVGKMGFDYVESVYRCELG